MKLVNQFPLYELGGALASLRTVCGRETDDAFEQLFALWSARKNLRAVMDGDQPLNFCRGAAVQLLDHIQACDAKLKMEEGKSIKPLAPWQMRALSNAIDVFEHQLSAELQKTASYSVPDKGIFHTEKLAESAEFHIHESIRSHLSPFALQEFRSAGRCLAFGLYSASGFHSTRAVEDVLRLYYEQFIGPPPDVPMGLLAGHLQDRLKSKDALPKPKENTVRHIRDVTNFDRNPLIHRGIELKEIDAMTLFNGALGVIVEMVKELSEADGQKPLPLQTEAIPLKRKGVTSAKTALLASPDEPPQS